MEGISSVNSSDGVEDDASTRPGSSRLSLGSSPSELSDDDGNTGMAGADDDFALDDGEGSLTPTEKIIMDEDDHEQLTAQQLPPLSPPPTVLDDDNQQHSQALAAPPPATVVRPVVDDNAVFDDGLFEDSSDTLSNAPMDMDDRDEEEDEEEPLLSSLSLTGDNAPLSPDPADPEPKEQDDIGSGGEARAATDKRPNGIADEPQGDAHMKDEDKHQGPSASRTTTSSADAPATSAAAAVPSSPSHLPPLSVNEDAQQQQQQTKISDHEDHTASSSPTTPSQSPTASSSRKRRGSQSLEQEEWQQRRSSKLVEINEQNGGSEQVSESARAPSSSEPESREGTNHEQEDNPCRDEVEETGCDHEYQLWHQEALGALTKIEVEFARLRDKMYQEKMSELNEEALMIAQGTHPELMAMMETIERKKNQRIQTADAWRKFKRVSYQRQFEGLEYQANIDFVCGKNALRRNVLDSLNRKRWDLDSEKDKLNEPLTDADRVPDPNVLLPRKRGQNEETRDLQRITHSIGFPMAPRAEGLGPDSVEEDLIALGIIPATTSATGVNQDKNSNKSSTTPTNAARDTLKSKVLDTSLGSNTSQIYAYQGHLHYHERVFRKGDQFIVVDANAGRYSAKLLTATDTEAHVQRTDGSKTRLPFIQMSRGKYHLYAKHS